MKRTILKLATAATAVLSIVAVAPQASGAQIGPASSTLTILKQQISYDGLGGKHVAGSIEGLPRTNSVDRSATAKVYFNPGFTSEKNVVIDVDMLELRCVSQRCAWVKVAYAILAGDPFRKDSQQTPVTLTGKVGNPSQVKLRYTARSGDTLPPKGSVYLRVDFS